MNYITQWAFPTICLLAFLTGCNQSGTAIDSPAQASLGAQSSNIRDATTGATASAQTIRQKAEEGAVAHPDMSESFWTPIRIAAAQIIQYLEVVGKSQAQLATVNQQITDMKTSHAEEIKKLADRISELESQNASLSSESVRQATGKWLALAGLAAIVAAGGLVLMFMGSVAPMLPKLGAGLAIGGGALSGYGTFMAIAAPSISRFVEIVTWIAVAVIGVGAVIGLVFGVLMLIQKYKASKTAADRAEVAVGNDAQDKLLAQGETAAAAAMAWASTMIETGDTGKAWESAKIVENSGPRVIQPTRN